MLSRSSYTHLQRLIVAPSQRLDAGILLTEQQQHYLHRVLRLQAGDHFIAITPEGWWLTELQIDQPAKLLQAIPVYTELPLAVTLLIALPKTGMDDVVRQATEIGVANIQLILSQRTLLNPSAQKLGRWQRIAQEAAEQSERQVVPEVLPPLPWQEALQHWNATQAICYLCEARGDYPHLLNCLMQEMENWQLEEQEIEEPGIGNGEQQIANALEDGTRFPRSILIAVGAEGGWTKTEIEQAIEAGYQPVGLGARILRSVTAPLVALSVIASVIETAIDAPKTLSAAQNR